MLMTLLAEAAAALASLLRCLSGSLALWTWSSAQVAASLAYRTSRIKDFMQCISCFGGEGWGTGEKHGSLRSAGSHAWVHLVGRAFDHGAACILLMAHGLFLNV